MFIVLCTRKIRPGTRLLPLGTVGTQGCRQLFGLSVITKQTLSVVFERGLLIKRSGRLYPVVGPGSHISVIIGARLELELHTHVTYTLESTSATTQDTAHAGCYPVS